jgi:hypothetical protein
MTPLRGPPDVRRGAGSSATPPRPTRAAAAGRSRSVAHSHSLPPTLASHSLSLLTLSSHSLFSLSRLTSRRRDVSMPSLPLLSPHPPLSPTWSRTTEQPDLVKLEADLDPPTPPSPQGGAARSSTLARCAFLSRAFVLHPPVSSGFRGWVDAPSRAGRRSVAESSSGSAVAGAACVVVTEGKLPRARHGRPLEALLIAPVQRVPRYTSARGASALRPLLARG